MKRYRAIRICAVITILMSIVGLWSDLALGLTVVCFTTLHVLVIRELLNDQG